MTRPTARPVAWTCRSDARRIRAFPRGAAGTWIGSHDWSIGLSAKQRTATASFDDQADRGILRAIELPDLQPSCSTMPGMVNQVMPERVTGVSVQVCPRPGVSTRRAFTSRCSPATCWPLAARSGARSSEAELKTRVSVCGEVRRASLVRPPQLRQVTTTTAGHNKTAPFSFEKGAVLLCSGRWTGIRASRHRMECKGQNRTAPRG